MIRLALQLDNPSTTPIQALHEGFFTTMLLAEKPLIMDAFPCREQGRALPLSLRTLFLWHHDRTFASRR